VDLIAAVDPADAASFSPAALPAPQRSIKKTGP